MKTFLQWAEERKLPLPDIKENTKRGGLWHHAYPSAYVRGQYPDEYFMPIAADAGVKMGYASSKNGKKPNDKAPADSAA